MTDEVVESSGEEALANQEQNPELLSEQPAGEESQESEAVETSGEQESEDKPKKKGGFQRKIDALTREKWERDQRIAEQERRLLEMQQQLAQQQSSQTPDDMPKLADFGYDEDNYRAAMQEWSQGKIQAFQDQQRQQMEYQRQVAEEQRHRQLLVEKIQKATEKYPDFQEKVFDLSVPSLQQINPYAYETLLEADGGDDVAYYLASNPQEIYRFHGMSPTQAAREITLMEGRLKAAPPRQVRTPPKPPSTVTEGTSEAVTDPNKMTTEEWMKWRNAQLQAKR